MMRTVTVRSVEKMMHVASSDKHSIVLDEPPESGDDLGMCPYELLLSSLGTCTAMTLRLYAERKGWPLGQVTVELSHEKVDVRKIEGRERSQEKMIDRIHLNVTLTGPLTGDQEARLREIVSRCPIYKTLAGRPEIIDSLDVLVPSA
jgi:uncharacterized OsmC-like protein